MNEILERYLADLQKKKRKPARASINAAQADLRGFIAWWETRGIPFDIELVIEEDLLDWHHHRQEVDGVKNTTINRANASLRGFFSWAHAAGLISHNPTEDLDDLPEEDVPPRSLPPEAIDWLLRLASAQEDQITRLRDRALITLLSDCGLRSQEAADVQLRDLDLRGAHLQVRAGKGRKPRRVFLSNVAIRRLDDYLEVRCAEGLPEPGSEVAREALLLGLRRDMPGRPWTPGMETSAMRKRLTELGEEAAKKVAALAEREPSLARVAELEELARKLAAASPHQLRHGLAYRLLEDGHPPSYVQQVLGHSRVSTTLLYGKPSQDDLRGALNEASNLTPRRREGGLFRAAESQDRPAKGKHKLGARRSSRRRS